MLKNQWKHIQMVNLEKTERGLYLQFYLYMYVFICASLKR